MLIAHHIDPKNAKRKKLKLGETVNFDYPCSSQTDCSPYSIRLSPGYYFLEVYGAGGQTIRSGNFIGYGGTGGYSSGVYHIPSKSVKLYLYIGGLSTEIKKPSYNGGGYGYNKYDGNGGGATDFRLKFGDWNETLDTRIIVAAGGGGGYANNILELQKNGGRGGGEAGEQGEYESNSNMPPYGTQVGSIGGIGQYKNGSFGAGASSYYGSGGGGYWGGGNAYVAAGSGGSGYIKNLLSLSKYPATSTYYTNNGSGKASITLVSFDNTCQTIHISFHFNPIIFIFLCLLK